MAVNATIPPAIAIRRSDRSGLGLRESAVDTRAARFGVVVRSPEDELRLGARFAPSGVAGRYERHRSVLNLNGIVSFSIPNCWRGRGLTRGSKLFRRA